MSACRYRYRRVHPLPTPTLERKVTNRSPGNSSSTRERTKRVDRNYKTSVVTATVVARSAGAPHDRLASINAWIYVYRTRIPAAGRPEFTTIRDMWTCGLGFDQPGLLTRGYAQTRPVVFPTVPRSFSSAPFSQQIISLLLKCHLFFLTGFALLNILTNFKHGKCRTEWSCIHIFENSICLNSFIYNDS